MTRQFTIILILSIVVSNIFGQTNKFGVSEVTSYPHTITTGSEQNWSITQDHRGVMYVGNNDKGILEYDGSVWRNIPITNNSIVRSLVTADDGTVYVGAVAECGYLAPDQNGDLVYHSLVPLLDTIYKNFSNVWKSYYHDGTVYFCSEKFILIYSTENRSFNALATYEHTLFCYLENDKLYSGTWLDGLVELKGDTIVKALGGDYYSNKNIYGLTSYDHEKLIVGTWEDGLSLYDIETGEVDSLFATDEVNSYLKNQLVTHILKLPSGDFLVSTYIGGLLVVTSNGEMKQLITKEEGLQDQIYSSYINPTNYPYPPAWSAQNIGIAKIQISSPLSLFTTKSGYEGLIYDVSSIDGRLFLGTSAGLFAMDPDNSKAEFSQIGDFNFSVWEFEDFTLKTGEKVLLAITDGGIYQISRNGRTVLLDDMVKNRYDPEGSRLWGYTVVKNPLDVNKIILGRETSINLLEYKNGIWYEEFSLEKIKSEARSIAIDDLGNLWFATTLDGVGKASSTDPSVSPAYYGTEKGLPTLTENFVARIGDEILFYTKDGIYRYDYEQDLFKKDTVYNKFLPEGKNWIFKMYEDNEGCLWISFENSEKGWMIMYLQPGEEGFTAVTMPFSTLPELSSTDAFYSEPDGNIWFPKSNVLYHFKKDAPIVKSQFRAMVRRVTIGADSVIFNGAYHSGSLEQGFKLTDIQDKEFIPHISHSENNVEFRWSAPYFDHEEAIEYSYFLVGFSKEWSPWEKVFYQDYTNLPQGTYTFHVKARNIYMDESIEDTFTFIILRPWYMTIVAFFIYLILAVFIVYLIIAAYTRRLKNENIRLEGIIQERTAEIRKQKEELTDSIEYASRIQRALLPPDEMLDKHDLEHFILFRPRDIVSGDFYWIGSNNNKIFIVAADCTGHGVPGAFMSMLGISFLDEIVIKSGVYDTNKILDALRQHVITSLRQTGKSMDESTKDGMDLAMISIDKDENTVQYSGAYNPLYTIRELNSKEKKIIKEGGELELDRGDLHNDTHILTQIRADQMPIGISEKVFNFSSHTLPNEKGTSIYLFSDGYVDQFGGPNGKKLMAKNFKKLLLDVQGMSMKKQHEILDQKLIEWMGDISQIDDVLVIGLKLG